jgi:methionyl-tRNA formyltransferase
VRVVYAGTPEFAVPALDALASSAHTVVAVYTQPDRPAGRGRALAQSPVKSRALALGLPVLQPETLRTPDAAATLAAFAPDVMVVAAYGLILPQAVLDVPRHGCVNIHGSLLPRWRGAAPIQRAVLAGDATTGICIMRMEKGLDTGPVYRAESVDVGEHETAGELHDRLATLGARLVVNVLDELAAGTAHATPQPAEGVTYAHKLEKREAAIDWSKPALEIERAVRAFQPWPIAETTYEGEQLRVHDARAMRDGATTNDGLCTADGCAPPSGGPGRFVAIPSVAPGTVLAANAEGIDVATGAGTLRLLRVQQAGRKAVTAREFLNAGGRAASIVGTRLGNGVASGDRAPEAPSASAARGTTPSGSKA